MLIKVSAIMVMFSVFLLIGLALKKSNIVKTAHLSSLAGVLLYAGQSALSAKPFLSADLVPDLELTKFILLTFAFSFFVQVAVFFVAKLVFVYTKNKDRSSIYTCATVFSNAGFIGIPLLEILTDNNPYAVLLGIIYNVAFSMLIWTLGIYILTGDKKAMQFQKAFLNPAILPLLFAVPMFYIPSINIFTYEPMMKMVEYLANLCAPLSMIIVGVRLGEMKLKEIFVGKDIYITAALKLLAAPTITLCIALLLNLSGLFTGKAGMYTLGVPVLLIGLAPAATVVALTEKFQKDSRTASKIFLSSTLISLVTTPLLVLLIQWAGLL